MSEELEQFREEIEREAEETRRRVALGSISPEQRRAGFSSGDAATDRLVLILENQPFEVMTAILLGGNNDPNDQTDPIINTRLLQLAGKPLARRIIAAEKNDPRFYETLVRKCFPMITKLPYARGMAAGYYFIFYSMSNNQRWRHLMLFIFELALVLRVRYRTFIGGRVREVDRRFYNEPLLRRLHTTVTSCSEVVKMVHRIHAVVNDVMEVDRGYPTLWAGNALFPRGAGETVHNMNGAVVVHASTFRIDIDIERTNVTLSLETNLWKLDDTALAKLWIRRLLPHSSTISKIDAEMWGYVMRKFVTSNEDTFVVHYNRPGAPPDAPFADARYPRSVDFAWLFADLRQRIGVEIDRRLLLRTPDGDMVDSQEVYPGYTMEEFNGEGEIGDFYGEYWLEVTNRNGRFEEVSKKKPSSSSSSSSSSTSSSSTR